MSKNLNVLSPLLSLTLPIYKRCWNIQTLFPTAVHGGGKLDLDFIKLPHQALDVSESKELSVHRGCPGLTVQLVSRCGVKAGGLGVG